jgi:hypothetical protein
MSRFKKVFANKLFVIVLAGAIIMAMGSAGFIFKDTILALFSRNDNQELKYIAFKKDNDSRWGILELSTGKVVIDDEWQETPYNVSDEGIVRVKNKNGFYEFYKIGEKPILVGSEYRNASDFNEGIAVVARENEYVSFIDANGKEIIKFKEAEGKTVEQVRGFSQGLAAFQDEDGKWGYVNKNGEVTIKAKYDRAGNFHEGLALVGMEESKVVPVPGTTPIPEVPYVSKLRFYFVDKTGKEAVKLPIGAVPMERVSEGLIIYSDDNGESWGVLNTKGEKIIKPTKKFKYIGFFSDGLAAFNDGDKWGVLNNKGEIIVRTKYNYTVPVNGTILVEDRGKIGYLDNNNNEIIKPEFDGGLPFWGNNTIVKDGNSYILIDRKGKQVGKTDFKHCNLHEVAAVHQGLTLVQVENDYFDINDIVGKMLSNVSRQEINGYTRNTSLLTVMKDCNIAENALPSYGDSLFNVNINKCEK